jgi:hypothetical protein
MKNFTTIVFMAFMLLPAVTQAAPADSLQMKKDVSSIDNIIAALYAVISGPAGERDWIRFRNLYHEKAYMGAVVKTPAGQVVYRSFTPDEYVKANGPFMLKNAFFEEELGRTVNQYTKIAQVFTSYQYRLKEDGPVEERGINSLQLVYFNDRWWITSIIWEDEGKENPLPEKFIKGR